MAGHPREFDFPFHEIGEQAKEGTTLGRIMRKHMHYPHDQVLATLAAVATTIDSLGEADRLLVSWQSFLLPVDDLPSLVSRMFLPLLFNFRKATEGSGVQPRPRGVAVASISRHVYQNHFMFDDQCVWMWAYWRV